MLKNTFLTAVWEHCRIWLYFILFLTIISLCLFIYQAQFMSEERGDLLNRHAELEKQFREREARLAETGVPVSAVEQIDKNLRDFAELIPDKKNFSVFLGELFAWAKQSNINIQEVSYKPKIDDEGKFLHYSLNFTVKGDYTNLKKFIHLLENSRRIIIVEKIGLSSNPNNDSTSVSLEINLTTFFREAAA